MKTLPRFALCLSLALLLALFVASSHFNPIPANGVISAAVASAQDQAPPPPGQYPDQGPDPAAVNQAPAPDEGNMAPSGQSYETGAPPQDQNPDDADYSEAPTATAPQPPPPLPDYDQPPPPADGYIWTPGYWAWGATGYYWVPGVWVEPPYMGALWTPGYWGLYGGHFWWHPGHWGLHIGFYGGINYGFGFFGVGYEGGYWNAGHFFYNRAYNHIDVHVVRNVYNYRAVNREVVNRTTIVNRSSYRGPYGVQARPQPAEGAAWREPTAPRMSTQVQHEQNYGAVRGQYANQNHGKPPSPAVNRPLPADKNVHAQPRASGGGEHRR